MKMKKILALSLSAALLLALLCACGDSGTQNSEPAGDPTDNQTQNVEPTDEPTDEPTGEPAGNPSGTVDLNAMWDEITALGELPMLGDTPEEFLADGYGIDPADLEAYISKTPMMNVQATEFFIAKVKEGRMDAVKEALLTRQASVASTFEFYLVDQYDLAQAYKLTTKGDYIFFAISEFAEQAEGIFNNMAS